MNEALFGSRWVGSSFCMYLVAPATFWKVLHFSQPTCWGCWLFCTLPQERQLADVTCKCICIVMLKHAHVCQALIGKVDVWISFLGVTCRTDCGPAPPGSSFLPLLDGPGGKHAWSTLASTYIVGVISEARLPLHFNPFLPSGQPAVTHGNMMPACIVCWCRNQH